MMFISVDLPDPEGPMMATYSLWRIFRLMPWRALTCCSEPMSYVRQMFSSTMTSLCGTVTGWEASTSLIICTAIGTPEITAMIHSRKDWPAKYLALRQCSWFL